MVDNEPRSLGFVHNIDYFVNADDEDLFCKFFSIDIKIH